MAWDVADTNVLCGLCTIWTEQNTNRIFDIGLVESTAVVHENVPFLFYSNFCKCGLILIIILLFERELV